MKRTLEMLSKLIVMFFAAVLLPAQNLPPLVEQMGYADAVFINGKVVSMDDASISTSPGRTYQGIAVKGDRILKLGSNQEVQALAGRITKVYDLKGRTLIPGIVESHQHIYGNSLRWLDRFGMKWPPNGIIIEPEAAPDLERSQGILRDAIRDAVKKVKPGEWVWVNMRPHPDQPPGALHSWGATRRLTNRKTLDQWSPNNPVIVSPGNRGFINSKGLEVVNEFLPGYSNSIRETMHGDEIGADPADIGWVGSQEMSVIEWEIFLNTLEPNTLAQMLKLESEAWASLGVTTFSSRIQFPKVMSGYAKLVELGQMPIRFDAHYEVHRMPTEPKETRQMYRRTGVLQGIGNDYFWFDGVASERWDSHIPEACLGPDTNAPANIKTRETCPKPGDLHWDVLSNAIKSGWRVAGVHTCGSESLRRFVQMIDEARQARGWTVEQIHDQHFSLEHCDMIGKQPDVIDKIKKYGIILSCGPDYIAQSRQYLKEYGPSTPNIEEWVVPFNTWIQSGVQLVGQHFGGGSFRGSEGSTGRGMQPPFFMPWFATTRKFDGRVWQPDERVDRVQALKMYTRWAAEYVRKPERLGSLEEGKWADLLIIDRDYFTIPVDDILKIRPLMTMVGGKMIVVNASLAGEWKMEPIGNQYNFDDKDIAWIGQPITAEGKKEAGQSN